MTYKDLIKRKSSLELYEYLLKMNKLQFKPYKEKIKEHFKWTPTMLKKAFEHLSDLKLIKYVNIPNEEKDNLPGYSHIEIVITKPNELKKK